MRNVLLSSDDKECVYYHNDKHNQRLKNSTKDYAHTMPPKEQIYSPDPATTAVAQTILQKTADLSRQPTIDRFNLG